MEEQQAPSSDLWHRFSKARKSFGKIEKDKQGYGYQYAGLDDILEKVEPPLEEEGLMIVNSIRTTDQGNGIIRTHIVDAGSGETLNLPMDMPIAFKTTDPQKVGSAITYFRRYALLALLNLCPQEADDDGEIASGDRFQRGATNNSSNNQALARQNNPNGAAANSPSPARQRPNAAQGKAQVQKAAQSAFSKFK